MDGNWFHIFLCLCCNDTIFKRFFTRSKTERKLNCSRALRRCRKIYEIGNIQPMIWSGLKIGPTREEASRNSAPNDQWTPRVPDMRCNCHFISVCGTTKVHKQGTLEVHFTSRGCLPYVPGVLVVQSAPTECPAAVQFPLCFTSCE
jgi:hypothetical protein